MPPTKSPHVLLLVFLLIETSIGFSSVQPTRQIPNVPPYHRDVSLTPESSTSRRRESTRLNLLLDVPDGFFTYTFPVLGIILSISKNFGRLRMEERAWEQRVEEAREKRLREDPTLTEIDLRRKEAALEWSAYGIPRMEEERLERERTSRVKVLEREYDVEDDDGAERDHRMSDNEIATFETEFGVEYDPYYDDPYSEEELPIDIPFNVDRKYGDRVYDNGEIFYKDKESNLYYRQGAKPRSLSFWN